MSAHGLSLCQVAKNLISTISNGSFTRRDHWPHFFLFFNCPLATSVITLSQVIRALSQKATGSLKAAFYYGVGNLDPVLVLDP